jgi:hypothetical protein
MANAAEGHCTYDSCDPAVTWNGVKLASTLTQSLTHWNNLSWWSTRNQVLRTLILLTGNDIVAVIENIVPSWRICALISVSASSGVNCNIPNSIMMPKWNSWNPGNENIGYGFDSKVESLNCVTWRTPLGRNFKWTAVKTCWLPSLANEISLKVYNRLVCGPKNKRYLYLTPYNSPQQLVFNALLHCPFTHVSIEQVIPSLLMCCITLINGRRSQQEILSWILNSPICTYQSPSTVHDWVGTGRIFGATHEREETKSYIVFDTLLGLLDHCRVIW